MSQLEFDILSKKIEKGIQLAAARLKEKTKNEGGELIFSKNGKVFTVSAKDLK